MASWCTVTVVDPDGKRHGGDGVRGDREGQGAYRARQQAAGLDSQGTAGAERADGVSVSEEAGDGVMAAGSE